MERGVKDVFVGLHSKGDDGTFYTDDDVLVAYTITDYSGKYIFEGLPAGEYVVQIYTFSFPEGHIFCPKGQGNNVDKDSDFNPDSGFSDPISLGARSNADFSVDAGVFMECGTGYTSVTAGYSQVVGKGAAAEVLSGLSIPASEQDLYEYQWMVKTGDGEWEPIPGATSYTYNPGAVFMDTYYVLCFRLKGCTGEYKESNVIVIQVGECNVAINADFTGNGCIGEAHTFTAGGMSATTTYEWAAEGGTISGSGKEVTITWEESGEYYVEVTASDADGCTHTSRKRFRILECNDYECCADGQVLTVLCLGDNGFGTSCTVYVPCEYTEAYLATGAYYCGECDNGNYCYAGTGTTASGSFIMSDEEVAYQAEQEAKAAQAKITATSNTRTPMGVNVYPNPAGSYTTVAYTADEQNVTESATIQLINRQAGLIMQKEVASHIGLNEMPLDLSNIAPGIYFIRVIKGDDVQVQRFVKMEQP